MIYLIYICDVKHVIVKCELGIGPRREYNKGILFFGLGPLCSGGPPD
jgi:hypothetical protein